MSETDVWHSMWKDECNRNAASRLRLHEQRLRIMQLESQRISMLGMFDLTIPCLKEHWPHYAQLLETQVEELRRSYENQEFPVQSVRVHSCAAPCGCTHETGSSAVSQEAHQLESPQRIPVSHSPAGAYAGEWDEVKS